MRRDHVQDRRLSRNVFDAVGLEAFSERSEILRIALITCFRRAEVWEESWKEIEMFLQKELKCFYFVSITSETSFPTLLLASESFYL